MTYTLHLGDCLDVMRGMADNSVDAVVTDPPYELVFMGKKWDASGITYSVDMWREVLRVCKPGAYLLAFGGTRTYHRLVCAIEDAGFEIRDCIEWVYGNGFPKSLDVSKAIDKAAGANRSRAILVKTDLFGEWKIELNTTRQGTASMFDSGKPRPATRPATHWTGWGTALKPAHEPIVVARKPLSEATVAENCLRWGTGALNIDSARIAGVIDGGRDFDANPLIAGRSGNKVYGTATVRDYHPKPQGRWPANLITDGSPEVVAMFPQSIARPVRPENIGVSGSGEPKGWITGARKSIVRSGYYDIETSAARFFAVCPLDEDDYPPLFYCAKASRREREAGLEGMPKRYNLDLTGGDRNKENDRAGKNRNGPIKASNHHPCVKPLSLCRYLITLCSREGATILDPFVGSGSTGVAAIQLGRNFHGIDSEPEYIEIARARCEHAAAQMTLPLDTNAPVERESADA